jgi:cytochrome oxidase Cu insertion factor (SCO1/SenC/PrrC family)
MRTISVLGVVLILMLPAAHGQRDKKFGLVGRLQPGDVAPDFMLRDIDGKRNVTLSALKGKPVVLFFGSCT